MAPPNSSRNAPHDPFWWQAASGVDPADDLLHDTHAAPAMAAALAAADDAAGWGDVPVGAVVYRADGIVSVGANERERRADPTAHAEIVAIRRAAETLGRWRLDDCALAVTLEPCAMCAGAIVHARLRALAFGAADPKAGAVGSRYNIVQDARLNHECAVRVDIAMDAAADRLTAFFQQRRG